MNFSHIGTLIQRDFKLELRRKHAIGGVLLYVVTTVFVAYLSFREVVNPATWNALFWIILLFAAFNAIAKSFQHEKPGLALYWYTVVSPKWVILAKMCYNTALMTLLGALSMVCYVLFMGSEALVSAHWLSLIAALFLGCAGLGTSLTLISAIASKTNNAFGIMAILGMPVILPLLLSVIRLSHNAIIGISLSENWKNALFLLLINTMSVALAYVLFPYLWRD